jgi:purine-binding chemotaxis protein CheW
MGRMADARKRARQKSGAEPPPPPAAAPEDRAPEEAPAPAEDATAPAEDAASAEEALPDDTVFPVDEAEAAPESGERIALPASGLAEDILPGLQAGDQPLASPVSLPASGLAEEILGQVEAAAAVETPGGGHSLSFFAAPAQQAKVVVEATEHLATFFLAGEEYGVEVRQVQEIRRVTEITSVPRAPEFIRGVINLRGRILPVLDLRRRLALGEVAMDRAARIVVVRIKERLLGLLVDGASQVLKVKVSQIEAPPEEVLQQGGDYIRGVAKLDDRLIILVDLERLLAHELAVAPGAAPGARGVEVKDSVSQE